MFFATSGQEIKNKKVFSSDFNLGLKIKNATLMVSIISCGYSLFKSVNN
ncbi:hypothetical protein FM120_03345 [Sphingobacterium faecium PCAi_F2.5]|nr:hypothetical protein FM120_03345 [Sphingobacterium faecium PCAi_F2.5]